MYVSVVKGYYLKDMFWDVLGSYMSLVGSIVSTGAAVVKRDMNLATVGQVMFGGGIPYLMFKRNRLWKEYD